MLGKCCARRVKCYRLAYDNEEAVLNHERHTQHIYIYMCVILCFLYIMQYHTQCTGIVLVNQLINVKVLVNCLFFPSPF